MRQLTSSAKIRQRRSHTVAVSSARPAIAGFKPLNESIPKYGTLTVVADATGNPENRASPPFGRCHMTEITLRDLYYCTSAGFIRVAESKTDGSRVHIDDVVSGLTCQCMCPGCGRDMVARKGEQRAHVFAHRAHQADNCSSPGETALHKFAKMVLRDRLRLKLPAITMTDQNGVLEVFKEAVFDFDEAALEKRAGEVVPDVICRRGGRDLHVEFLVTHACDPTKLAKLNAMDVGVLEIDLRRYRNEPLNHLDEAILFKAPRNWLQTRMFAKGTRMMEERKNAIEREKDDEARALWQIYIERPAESQFSLGPWQEKANEYGLRKAVSGGGQHKTCFEVRDAEWKSFVLLEIACRRGPWPFDAFMAMCSKGWVHQAFVFRDNDLASRMRKLERAYRSPYERYSDFLKDMTKSGLLGQAGSGIRGSMLLWGIVDKTEREAHLPDIGRAVVEQRIADDRANSLFRRPSVASFGDD